MKQNTKWFGGVAALCLAASLAGCDGSNDDNKTMSNADAAATPAQASVDTGIAAPADTDATPVKMERASAILKGVDGADIGTVHFQQTPNGVLISGELSNLPPGAHGFHIHAVGACTPDFAAAGGHFSPMKNMHGYLVKGGPHAGDMPNIHVDAGGQTSIELFNPAISLHASDRGYLFDEDGAAVIIHQDADDYQSQPSGAAGDRIACGVITADASE
ncbi:MAG TPA: superoxide dismutase family protein [Parvularculaceae bacterium]|nr:superoxide dismutase family protein [Parvularculaceae bacterium]